MDTQHLDNFLTGLKSYLDAQADARKAYNREVALEFNPLLQFFYKGNKSLLENQLSDIIAYFLDPREKHGQGDVFLRAFLKSKGLPCKGWNVNSKKAEVYREHFANGKLDIYIHFPESNHAIGIEMKIGAVDQPEQLSRYHSWLENEHPGKHCLIYWQPYLEGKPAEHSLPKEQRIKLEEIGQYCLFSHWKDTTSLLKKWTAASRAENVRTFLKHFLQLVNHKINGERFMGQHDQIVGYFLQRPDLLDIAREIIDVGDKVYNTSLSLFVEAWKKYKWPTEVTAEDISEFHWGREYARFSFKINTASYPFTIAFEWCGRKYEGGDYGFRMINKGAGQNWVDSLKNVFGEAHIDNDWPWFQHWEEPYKVLKLSDLVGKGQEKFLQAIAEKIQFLLEGLKQVELPPVQN